jgi:hypothetical protein
MKRVLVVLAGVVLFAMLAVDIYLRLQPSRGSVAVATPRPSPSPSLSPSPSPSLSPTPATPAPATGTATPVIQVDESKPDAVVPATPRPRTRPRGPRKPAARATAVPAGRPEAERKAERSFVPGETTFQTGSASAESGSESLPDTPAGFDPGGVTAKAAPKVPALLEFDVQPKRVAPGQPYAVRIYLRNHGKKAIKIRELRLASTLNGSRSESTLTPKLKEVPAQMSALLAEVSSVWTEGVGGWSMEVTIRSGHGDVYRNTVSWR